MSFYDSASLAFLPSGGAGKDGKAYSIKPRDGSGDFTFSRGSNLTSTRVDSNGLIEKGRENLLKQSNTFNTTWISINVSETTGHSGYDGSSNAWLLTKSSANGRLYQSVSFSGVNTFSIYLKKNDSDWARLYFDTINISAYIDLRDGSFGNTSSAIIEKKIVSVGDDWYRISITMNGSGTVARVYPAEQNSDSASSGSIYIQDAQLEIGLVATEPILSGASTGLAGILEDSPRFDYSGGASCPSLLLEPSRTNLIGYSEYANGNGWVIISSGTIVDNVDTSPEGVVNAFSFETTTFGALRYNVTLSTSTTYTFSFYAKNVDATRAANYRVFNNDTATDLVPQTSYLSQLSTTEWKRISLTFTTNATNTGYSVYVTSGNQEGTILFYGAQLEQGSYPTSYIPNHSGGSVTRNVDDLNDLDISSMLTTSSFTWFLDLNDYIGSDINSFNIWLQSTSSSIEIQFRVRPDGYRFYYSGIAGGSVYPINGSTTANKFCISYDGNDYRLYVDGTLEATTRSVGDSGWDKIRNSMSNASLPLKQILLFPSALSDADLEILTGTSYESFAAMATALNYTTYE